MSGKDQNLWHISHSWTQPWRSPHWTDELDQLKLIMMAMDLLDDDPAETDCSQAQQMLADIGISC